MNLKCFFMGFFIVLPAGAVSNLIIPKKQDFIRLPNDTINHVGRYTNVRIGGDGLPIISFNDEKNGGIRVVRLSYHEGAHNHTDVIVDGHIGQVNNGRFLRMEINPHTQKPYFAYISGGKKSTMVALCNNKDCTDQEINEIFLGPARHPSLAFRPNGLPVVAYSSLPNKKMLVTMCQDFACRDYNTIKIMSNKIPIVGDYIHVEVGNDNIPVFSWFSAGSNSLKYGRCSDENCSDIAISTVDYSSKKIGLYNFMRLDSQGNAIIMYTDVTHGYLKTAFCSDVSCSKPVITIVDDNIGAGKLVRGVFPEIAINPKNGLPILSYVAQPNDAAGFPQGILKVAQCRKPDCREFLLQEIARGGFGYGRDSSMAFKDDLLYLTFLDYNNNKKLTYLAVLKQQK